MADVFFLALADVNSLPDLPSWLAASFLAFGWLAASFCGPRQHRHGPEKNSELWMIHAKLVWFFSNKSVKIICSTVKSLSSEIVISFVFWWFHLWNSLMMERHQVSTSNTQALWWILFKQTHYKKQCITSSTFGEDEICLWLGSFCIYHIHMEKGKVHSLGWGNCFLDVCCVYKNTYNKTVFKHTSCTSHPILLPLLGTTTHHIPSAGMSFVLTCGNV